MDTEGNTPFDWADEGGHGECAVFLWENGANIKARTGKGMLRISQIESLYGSLIFFSQRQCAGPGLSHQGTPHRCGMTTLSPQWETRLLSLADMATLQTRECHRKRRAQMKKQ